MAQSPELTSEEVTQINQRVKTGFFWILTTTITWQAISWVLTLITARLLNPSDYGIIALAETVYPYLFVICSLRLDTWILQEKEIDAEKEGSCFSLLLVLAAVATIVCLAAGPIVGSFYGQPEVRTIFFTLSIIFFFRSTQVLPEALLRRELRFKEVGTINLVVGTLRGLLQVLLAFFGWGFWALVWGIVFREITASLALLWRKGLPARPRWEKDTIKRAFAFGVSATGASICWLIFSTSDNLVVGKLFGPTVLGFYAMAFFLTELPLSKLNAVLFPILGPYYARLKSNTALMNTAYLNVTAGIVGMVAPMLFGLSVTAREVTLIVLGDKWIPLIEPLRIMCFVGILRTFTTNTFPVLYALGKPNDAFKVSLFTALSLPPAFALMGYYMGIHGVYLAWFLVYPLTGILPLLLNLSRHTGITARAYLSAVTPAIIASCLMTLGIELVFGSLTETHIVLSLMGKAALGVALYYLCMRYMFNSHWAMFVGLIKDIRGGFKNK